MEISTLLIAIPVFFVVYQGVGIVLDNRRSPHPAWGTSRLEQRSLWTVIADRSAQFGPNKVLLRNKSVKANLDLLLLRSGNPYGWSIEKLLLCKELAMIAVPILLWQSDLVNPLLLLFGAFAGFKAIDFFLGLRTTARMDSIQRALPGYVDLLALTMESGLDLLTATERIIEKMKGNPLRTELQMLLQETKLGTARKEALLHLAHRAYLPDVQSLTSLIIQSEELGTSLAGVLRTYAEDMRGRRIVRAEEVAGKAPVKLLLPMMVFFFPIVFVIIFGPIALSFIKGNN